MRRFLFAIAALALLASPAAAKHKPFLSKRSAVPYTHLASREGLNWPWWWPVPVAAGGIQKPGPSAALFASNPYYSCTNNRYVSASGSSGNNGLTAGTPWDINTAAAYAAPAGTCMNVIAGTYNLSTISNGSLFISHGGTGVSKTGYVVWRCTTMPFSFSSGVLQGENSAGSCRFADNDGYFQSIIQVETAYVMFDGLELDGESQGYNCFSNVSSGGSNANVFHHVWVFNSDMHHCWGQAGIQWGEEDFLFVLHNAWHDNSVLSGEGDSNGCGCGGSGFSNYQPVGLTIGGNPYTPTPGNTDYWHSATTGLTYSLVVNYNVGYNNNDGGAAGTATDGEGIIFDDMEHGQLACPGVGICPFTGSVLSMGNLMFNNGGSGIEVFAFTSGMIAHVTLANNSLYNNNNNADDNNQWGSSLYLNGTKNIGVFNNISESISTAHPCPATPPPPITNATACNVLDGANVGVNSWQSNITYPAGLVYLNGSNTYPTTGANKNIDGTDPKFVNPTTPNFALQAGSIAIGGGQAFDLWQQSGTVDVGACVSSLTNCP